jgi:HAD superfamily hydrolase (TIGR01509 family)
MKAVIFDCDGVLVDSEPLSIAAWTTVLAVHGFQATDADFQYCLGRSRKATLEYFTARHALPDPAAVDAAVQAELDRLIEIELEAFPDAVETVRELALRGVPLAVASSSRRTELDRKLARIGLHSYFDVSVAGDEVAAAKPAPDLFLAAADGLGVVPDRCLVIEDSVAGVDAATAAGMRFVAVARPHSVFGEHASVDRLDAQLIITWMGW